MENDNGTKGNLLVLDDEPEILNSIQRQFRKKYNLYLSSSPEEAYGYMKENNIQVVIVDQRMPDSSGTEFLKAINKEFPESIGLILTAYSDINAATEAIELGNVHKYIQKPWIPMELSTVIEQAFEKQKLIAQNNELVKNLEKANKNLESKVKEKTKKLRIANLELRKKNRELLKVAERAGESDKLKSSFLANLYHEIRTPLTKILGFTDMIAHYVNEIDEARKKGFHEYLRQSSNDFLNTIENLVDITKLEINQLELENEPCSLKEIFQTIELEVSKKQKSMKKTHVHFFLQNELEAKQMFVITDQHYLQKVLNLLLDNAFKFTLDGYVKLCCEKQDDKTILFSIKDTGIGIPLEKQKIIFENFRQSEESLSRRFDGLGIGLSIAEKIVNCMGGNIWLDSAENKGSTFYLSLPHRPTKEGIGWVI